jgi:hypothetical protein
MFVLMVVMHLLLSFGIALWTIGLVRLPYSFDEEHQYTRAPGETTNSDDDLHMNETSNRWQSALPSAGAPAANATNKLTSGDSSTSSGDDHHNDNNGHVNHDQMYDIEIHNSTPIEEFVPTPL